MAKDMLNPQKQSVGNIPILNYYIVYIIHTQQSKQITFIFYLFHVSILYEKQNTEHTDIKQIT